LLPRRMGPGGQPAGDSVKDRRGGRQTKPVGSTGRPDHMFACGRGEVGTRGAYCVLRGEGSWHGFCGGWCVVRDKQGREGPGSALAFSKKRSAIMIVSKRKSGP